VTKKASRPRLKMTPLASVLHQLKVAGIIDRATSSEGLQEKPTTSADTQKEVLLDEVEAALRYWDNARFLGLDKGHQHDAMLRHIASLEAARAGGCSVPEVCSAIDRAGEPLPIPAGPKDASDE
jgi:hypothetical protein